MLASEASIQVDQHRDPRQFRGRGRRIPCLRLKRVIGLYCRSRFKSLRLEGSGGGRLGKSGDTVAWPIAKLANGSRVDLSVADAPHSGIGDKLFAGPLAPSENWCALERPSAGVRIRVNVRCSRDTIFGFVDLLRRMAGEAGSRSRVCVATGTIDGAGGFAGGDRAVVARPRMAGESFSWTMEVEIEKT